MTHQSLRPRVKTGQSELLQKEDRRRAASLYACAAADLLRLISATLA
jgi:hypothetical protein